MRLENLDMMEIRKNFLEQATPLLEGNINQNEFENMTWFLDNFLMAMKANNIMLIKAIEEKPVVQPEVMDIRQPAQKLRIPSSQFDAASEPTPTIQRPVQRPIQPDQFSRPQRVPIMVPDVVEEEEVEIEEPLTPEELEIQKMYNQTLEEVKKIPVPLPPPKRFNEKIKALKINPKEDEDDEE